MATVRERFEQILAELQGESLADAFADVIEDDIEYAGTAEDYFASMMRLPSPFLELYAALIFHSAVRMDGPADAVPRYDTAEFMAALETGLAMLHKKKLFSVIGRIRQYLRSADLSALLSQGPNVWLDRETGGISKVYWNESNGLMSGIGDYLLEHRDLVMKAADKLDTLNAQLE
jgi:hypothetical protein